MTDDEQVMREILSDVCCWNIRKSDQDERVLVRQALSAMRTYASRVRAEHPGPGWHFDPLHATRCSHGHLPIDGCSAGCHAAVRTGDK